MKNVNFFDMPDSHSAVKQQAPFFTLKKASSEDKLAWLKAEVKFREDLHEDFFNECKRNLQAYRGAYHRKPGKQSDSLESTSLSKFTSKYVVNHLYELTENFVSKMTRVKPGLEILPSNDEYADKLSAKAVDLLVKHLMYINDFDGLLIKLQRHRLIFGEAYIDVKWNPELGDLHPEFEAADKDLKELIKVELNKETPIRIGDVELKLELPWNILLENCNDFSDCQTIIQKKLLHVAELKKLFPEQSENIINKNGAQFFNIDKLSEQQSKDYVWLYTFSHKPSDEFPEGLKIQFTEDLILSEDILGSYLNGFSLIRMSDIDVPGCLHGVSRYNQVLSLQNAHNNLSQSILKNEFLLAAPKWVMPKGSCKIDQLNNGRTVLQYQGPIAPQLVQMNPTSPTTINLRQMMENEMAQIFGVHQVSRGEPPKGITAAVALQFLYEQENERAISDITKHNNFIVELSKKMISVAGHNYQPDDGRILRIFGKNNKHMLFYFDTAHLGKDYDIRVQLSSALPQSKAARMERILTTIQYNPEMLPPERWVELLEFGAVEKMHTLITEAINSAESEEEDMLAGIKVNEPQPWEDHIIHLQSHYKRMQSRSFKEEIDPADRAAFIEHVEVTEMLAYEMSQKNPAFAARLAQLPQFPLFFDAPVPQSMEQRQAIVQGQANQGLPITTEIPAAPLDEPKIIR